MSTGNSQAGMVYGTDGLSQTICSGTHGYAIGYIAVGSAMRGRYDSDGKISQQIEVRDDEISNCITSVQKDSLVVENFQKPETE